MSRVKKYYIETKYREIKKNKKNTRMPKKLIMGDQ